MSCTQQLEQVIEKVSPESLRTFFEIAAGKFRPGRQDRSHELADNQDLLESLEQLGEIEFSPDSTLIVLAGKITGDMTRRRSRTRQYDVARKIIKQNHNDAAIFVFYDDDGRFRFSLITAIYSGKKREFSTFKRYTYYVDPVRPNKTFRLQIGRAKFESLNVLLKAFSLDEVSSDFYNNFKPIFDNIALNVQGNASGDTKENQALLFVIRTIFLGFVQKKGWLGKNPEFLQSFWQDYTNGNFGPNTFYSEWLEPMFFEAMNNPPGHMVRGGNTPYSEENRQALQMAPYLNGELFKKKWGVDDQALIIPDEQVEKFFDFLFQYNFTIEENTRYDEELELNPEFLGIIFERLVNKVDGAVYTPRTEVDFMCRLSLVKWLEKNLAFGRNSIDDLYHLLFREGGSGSEYDDDQKQGDFTKSQIGELIKTLREVTVCDPAAGSGAFEVGMMQVLGDILENLETRNNCPDEYRYKPGEDSVDIQKAFERKKAIIANTLYGVEVKRWAVWINQLRLWLSLFIDMPDEMRNSQFPLLPNLNFKVRCGDSIVQRIAGKLFPIQGHADLPTAVKRKVAALKKKKRDFFYNDESISADSLVQDEYRLFCDIIDAEIRQKQSRLDELNSGRGRQGNLFGEDNIQQRQLFEQEMHQLRQDIEELQAEKLALRNSSNRPLVWSIEFAEIFHDRGGFDIIIGNPPYVQKEDIADPNGNLSTREYKEALKQVIRSDYPSYFLPSVRINGRSDLYVYFYLRTLRLLNQQGIHCFICSNSWLDVGYGVWMQRFLLYNVQMHRIIDNHAKRSFSTADVNTIISLFDAPGEPETDHLVQFVAFKKTFEESLTTENLLVIEHAIQIEKQDTFRVYPVTTVTLREEGCSGVQGGRTNLVAAREYTGDKWGGKYLRAPDFFLSLIADKQEKLLRLGDSIDNQPIVEVLGYVHDNNTGEQFPPVKFIRSIRETRRISLEDQDVYLRGVNTRGNSRIIADVLFPRTFGRDHLALFNIIEAVGKEFYRVIAKAIDRRVLALYMNSSFFILQRELIGLANLGGGGLKFGGQDIPLFYIPKLLRIIPDSSLLQNFLDRRIQPIFEEIGINPESDVPIEEQEPNPLPDRKELDDIVFDALDLTEEERKDVYRAVCRLVWNRVNRANSV
ncbi:MAG: Eco57I restriction-modification methylase domain-containing protein [Phycisphaerae bacterium]|nr:Eco57I restriction-modification methylase domain-containing protein [Phycisphaerae bacterium]